MALPSINVLVILLVMFQYVVSGLFQFKSTTYTGCIKKVESFTIQIIHDLLW